MDVRMRSGQRIPAVLAGAAGLRWRSGAEQALPEPQRQALFANAGWAVQEERARERVTPDGVIEPRAQGVVAVNRKQRHMSKVRVERASEQCRTRHVS